jgi:chromosome segregation ATPase
MSDAPAKLDTQSGQPASRQEIESCLLAAADAIRDLIAERNQLRNRVEAQERELVSLNAKNKDLQRQITLIGESWKRLMTPLDIIVDDAMRQAELPHASAQDWQVAEHDRH